MLCEWLDLVRRSADECVCVYMYVLLSRDGARKLRCCEAAVETVCASVIPI
jgi:hypothetical protein